MKGRFLRLFITAIFVFSLIPVTLLQQVSPVNASTGWTKFTGNLSLNDKYVLDSCVIKDGTNNYKMWYTRLNFDMSPSELFSDMKGLNLGSVLTDLQTKNLDGFLNDLNVINTTTLWTTILGHVRTVIGYAESTDGKNWTVVNSNILGITGSFLNSVGFPSVVKALDGSYKMWYTSLVSTLNQTMLDSKLAKMANFDESIRRGAFDDLLNSTKTVINYTDTTAADGSSGWSTPTTALAPTGGVPGIF